MKIAEMTSHMTLLLLLCSYRVQGLQPDAYSKEDFPDPRKEFTKCGQEDASYVCDPSQSLTSLEAQTICLLIESIQYGIHKMHNDSELKMEQHQVLVAIVPRIQDSSNPQTPELQRTRQFAEYLRDAGWRSENRVRAEHIVIVHDLNTRTTWTATDDFARKVITDDRADKTRLCVTTRYFRSGNVSGGLHHMLTKYKRFLDQGMPFVDRFPGWLLPVTTTCILLVLAVFLYWHSYPDLSALAGVWIVVGGMAVEGVSGLVVRMAVVGAMVGLVTSGTCQSGIWIVVLGVLLLHGVMLVAVVVAMCGVEILSMQSEVATGAALLLVVGKATALMVAAGVGVFGAALGEYFRVGFAAAKVILVGIGILAALVAALISNFVVEMLELDMFNFYFLYNQGATIKALTISVFVVAVLRGMLALLDRWQSLKNLCLVGTMLVCVTAQYGQQAVNQMLALTPFMLLIPVSMEYGVMVALAVLVVVIWLVLAAVVATLGEAVWEEYGVMVAIAIELVVLWLVLATVEAVVGEAVWQYRMVVAATVLFVVLWMVWGTVVATVGEAVLEEYREVVVATALLEVPSMLLVAVAVTVGEAVCEICGVVVVSAVLVVVIWLVLAAVVVSMGEAVWEEYGVTVAIAIELVVFWLVSATGVVVVGKAVWEYGVVVAATVLFVVLWVVLATLVATVGEAALEEHWVVVTATVQLEVPPMLLVAMAATMSDTVCEIFGFVVAVAVLLVVIWVLFTTVLITLHDAGLKVYGVMVAATVLLVVLLVVLATVAATVGEAMCEEYGVVLAVAVLLVVLWVLSVTVVAMVADYVGDDSGAVWAVKIGLKGALWGAVLLALGAVIVVGSVQLVELVAVTESAVVNICYITGGWVLLMVTFMLAVALLAVLV